MAADASEGARLHQLLVAAGAGALGALIALGAIGISSEAGYDLLRVALTIISVGQP